MVVFEMLMARGARISAKNDGNDTPLHLACAHGNKDVVHKVSKMLYRISWTCFLLCLLILLYKPLKLVIVILIICMKLGLPKSKKVTSANVLKEIQEIRRRSFSENL